MNAASPRPFHSDYSYSRVEHGTGSGEKSLTKVLPQSSCQDGSLTARGMAAGPAHRRAMEIAEVRDAGIGGAAFRAWFAPAFARWLQVNFRDAEAVAATFGVRYQTALNWWNACNRASGDTVALVFLTFPQAVAWFLSEWEGGR